MSFLSGRHRAAKLAGPRSGHMRHRFASEFGPGSASRPLRESADLSPDTRPAHAATRALGDGGRPLPAPLRSYFEPRFGRSFASVRLHDGPGARTAAAAIGARAYTLGDQIALGPNAPRPEAPAGRRLLAHELAHVAEAPRDQTIRRQPVGSGEAGEPPKQSDFTLFIADPRKARDARFARRLAREDSERLRKAGKLDHETRLEIAAKLRFFEGTAWENYQSAIRPALLEVTQEVIEMPAADLSAGFPKAQPYEISERFRFLRDQPTYIDNDIRLIEYFTAEQARITYGDGSTFMLGLVPRWMKPPVVEVECDTPADELRIFEDTTTGRLALLNEREMAAAPRSTPYAQLLKTYARYVDFFIEQGTVRVVPSRINMRTAPTLCRVLVDSRRRFEEQVDLAVQLGRGGTIAIGGYAGAGGLPKNIGVGLPTATARATGGVAARTTGAGAARTTALSAEAAQTLKTLSATADDVASFANGAKIWIDINRGGAKLAAYFQKVGDKLTAGVLSLKGNLDRAGMIRAYFAFRKNAARLARETNSKVLRLEADVVVDPDVVLPFLISRGFKEMVDRPFSYYLELAVP